MKALVIVLALLYADAAAQHGFGVRGGLNLANVISSSSEPLVSFCAGLYYQYQENKPFTLRAELSYSVQGAELKTGFLGTTTTLKLDYIHLAPMARFHYRIFSLHVGPQLGVLIVGTHSDVNITDTLNPLDINLNFGIGVEIPGGTEFGVRYVLGFTDITKDDQTNFKNEVLQFTVSFPFHGHGHARREAPRPK